MVRRFIRIALVFMVSLAPTACETPDPVQKLPAITFAHLPALTLNAGSVNVVSKYTPPMAAPNVDHQFPTPPEKALRQWASDRLKAGGRGGAVRFTIVDASVKEAALKKKTGIKAAFTKQQSERYDAAVEAMVEILDDRGFRKGVATARAVRSRTVREDATLNERELVWFEMTEAMMKNFNAELEKNIRRHLGAYLM